MNSPRPMANDGADIGNFHENLVMESAFGGNHWIEIGAAQQGCNRLLS
jgi:hypothetical protein